MNGLGAGDIFGWWTELFNELFVSEEKKRILRE